MSGLNSKRSDRSTSVGMKQKKKGNNNKSPSNKTARASTGSASPPNRRNASDDNDDEYDRSKIAFKPGSSMPAESQRDDDGVLTGLPGTRVKFLWKDIKGEDSPESQGDRRNGASNSNAQRAKSPVPRRTIQKPERQHRTTASSAPPPPLSVAPRSGESHQHLLQRILKWEEQLKSNMKDAQLPYPPLKNGVTDSLPMAFRKACAEIIKTYPESAKRMSIDKRLWVSWYREIDGLQGLLRSSSTGSQSISSRSPSPGGNPRRSDDAIRQLQSVLASCTEFYTRLVAELRVLDHRYKQQQNDAESGNEQQHAIRFSLHMCLVALGDTARYAQKVLPNHPDWSIAQQFYQKALQFLPSSGKVYNQLALLAINQQQVLKSVYLYARSLACEAPFSSRDNFVHAVHRGKATDPALQVRCRSIAEVQDRVAALFLSCLDIVFTGSERDSWQASASIARSGLKYLLESCTSSLLARERLDRAAVQDGLNHIVCLLIFSLHHLLHPVGVRYLSRSDFDQETSTWKQNRNVQNLLTLGFSIVTAIIKECAKAILSPKLMVIAKDLMNMLLPPISIYLDWLRLHPWFLASSRESIAMDFLSCTLNFLFSLSSSLLADRIEGEDVNQLSAQLLPEDKELFGFLPSECGISRRQVVIQQCQQEVETCDDDDALLDIRMCRILSFSEAFLELNGHVPPSEVVWKLQDNDDAAVSPGPILLELSPDVPDSSDSMDSRTGGRSCKWCLLTGTFDDGRCKFCGCENADKEEAHGGVVGDEEVAFLSELLLKSSAVTKSAAGLLNGVNLDEHYCSRSPPGRRGSPPRKDRSPREQIHSSSGSSSPSSDAVGSPGFAAVMAIGADKKLYDASSHPKGPTQQKCLIVIDAPNVAMRHGFHKRFSCIGIRLAIEYFVKRGHRVVGFLPDYLVRGDEVGERKRLASAGVDVPASKLPDNVALLQHMVEHGLLIPTPAQDYDDTYCIQYAGMYDGCVVTNDLYRDHVENMTGPRERKVAMRSWLAAHRISYTWVGNEFLPNPNFRYPSPATQ